MRLLDAIRAEVLKVTTTRMWWILAIVTLVYMAFIGLSLGAAFSFAGDEEMGLPLGDTALAHMVYSLAVTMGYVFPLVLGALSVTGEFRHQTLTPTFLAVPHRGVALLAKGIVQLVLGMVFGVVAFLGTMAAGGSVIAATGGDAALGSGETWLLVLRGVVGMGLWAVIGVGFGALIRNQVAAIVVILALTQFVEPLLRSIAMLNEVSAKIANVLPGSASDALTGASFYQSFGTSSSSLDWWAGGLILIAYAVGAAFLGYWVTWRRDVT
ncbi:MAG: ABC transporter permease [Salana multivorans]|uniref:ABC transporter permease n=1 Tax=Salana multivorans TaxID=120377 RepID=UPI000968E2A2|nr:ABC transporter permease [Salana multivorans]MBN8883796.1 ABC transporter permease [Salana multivorans]OJX93769.1 MAG: hypothetical protein BGO96_14665 [Micrococcales bacterium 73-15]